MNNAPKIGNVPNIPRINPTMLNVLFFLIETLDIIIPAIAIIKQSITIQALSNLTNQHAHESPAKVIIVTINPIIPNAVGDVAWVFGTNGVEYILCEVCCGGTY